MKKLVETAIEKLLKLENLIVITDKMYEEHQDDDKATPFSSDGIKIQSYLAKLQYWVEDAPGRDSDEFELSIRNRETLAEMMFRCNEIWRTRTAVKSGDLDITSLDHTDLDLQIINFIKENQKITAIKHYRATMKEMFNQEKTLKESKDYVDAIAERFQRQAGEHKTI